MSLVCNVLTNTRGLFCPFNFRNVTTIAFQKVKQDDGTLNEYDTVNDFIDNYVANCGAGVAKDARIFPVTEIVLEEAPEVEIIREELADSTSINLGSSRQTVSLSIPQASPEYKKVLEAGT